MAKIHSYLFPRLIVCCCLLALGGCSSFWGRLGMTSKPVDSAGIPKHETWCYRTLGEIDCYTAPQNNEAERLVAVEPPSRTPLTRQDHTKAAAQASKDAP